MQHYLNYFLRLKSNLFSDALFWTGVKSGLDQGRSKSVQQDFWVLDNAFFSQTNALATVFWLCMSGNDEGKNKENKKNLSLQFVQPVYFSQKIGVEYSTHLNVLGQSVASVAFPMQGIIPDKPDFKGAQPQCTINTKKD